MTLFSKSPESSPKIGRAWIFVVPLLLACLSCQDSNADVIRTGEIADLLQANAEVPNGFQYELTSHRPPEEKQLTWKGDFLQQSAWVSCQREQYRSNALDSDWTFGWDWFHKRVNGLDHRIEEGAEEEYWEWHCGSIGFESLPLYGLGVYPSGGWSLCGQAASLIRDFPPSRGEASGAIVQLTWNTIPEALNQDLSRQAWHQFWEVYPRATAMRLSIDIDQGVPTALEVDFEGERNIIIHYRNFKLLGDGYTDALRDLRSQIDIPPWFTCWCDGKIYEVYLPNRGAEGSDSNPESR